MILHSYFAKRFLMCWIQVFILFYLFSLMIEMANQLRWHADLTDFKTVFFLAVLNSTEVVYTIMPLIMIFASIWLFLALARSSELVVARASGRSGLTFLLGPVGVSVLLSGLILMFLNPIVAYTTARYLTLSQEIKNEGRSVFSIGTEGLWLRQGDTEGYTVVRASGANGAGSVFYDVTFYVYGSDGEIYKRLGADVARLGNGEWRLYTAKSWPLSKNQNSEENASVLASTTLPTDMTQEQVRDRFETPATVPIWNLASAIQKLKSAGFSAKRHEVWLQAEFARPLFLISMVLLGSAFCMRHVRFGGTGIAVLSAVICGFGLFYIRNFAQVLGESGQLPVLVAVWTPPFASLLLSLSIILHMEDG